MAKISGFPPIWNNRRDVFCRKLAQERSFLGLKEERFSGQRWKDFRVKWNSLPEKSSKEEGL
jgi:hypothetical protein